MFEFIPLCSLLLETIPLWTLSKDPRVQFQFIIFRIEIAMTWGYYYSMFETVYGKFELILPCQSPLIPSFTLSASCSWCLKDYMTIPTGSMYAIYGNIYHQYTPNVSIYTILGSYDYMTCWISGVPFTLAFLRCSPHRWLRWRRSN